MPRLVRRAPLAERIKSYIDPSDWLLWLSEELNTSDWDSFSKAYGLIIGATCNILYIIVQANSVGGNDDYDDILVGSGSSGWFRWFCRVTATILAGLCFGNGFLTFWKKRHYRLFEQPIETTPSTPAARRVRVDSSPAAVSSFRFLQDIWSSNSAESRAHPDAGRDVWEIAVWDPNPLCLELFCLFSPLHIVHYYLNLPVAPLDPQPSVKVVTTIVVGALLSFSLSALRTSFSHQIRDATVIQREVLHEYDNKFVHPTVQRVYRDVGIQTISKKVSRDSSVGVRGSSADLASDVTTYTPTTIINRTFRTNPNPNYASQYDPDDLNVGRSGAQTPSRRAYQNSSYTSTTTATGNDFSSPIRPSNTPNPFRQQPPQPQFRPTGTSDGGSLGVYSHANSPLRKSASANFMRDDRSRESLGGQGERRLGSPVKREGSPLKRVSMPGNPTGSERSNGAVERLSRNYGGLGIGRRESGRF